MKLSVDTSESRNGACFGTTSEVAGCRVRHEGGADSSVSDATRGPKIMTATRPAQWM